jgi:hypothetical protein
MRPRTLVAFGIALMVTGLGSATARAQDNYHHGRLRYADPGVMVQRASDSGAEEAAVNEPFLPGDRVWTDGNGRAEFQFGDGSVVRVDRRSKLDYAGHDEDRAEHVVLRLWSGSVMIRVRPRSDTSFEIETPGGSVLPAAASLVRIDVDAGEARVSVYEGEGTLDDGRDRVTLAAGERTYARGGSSAEEPERFDVYEQDDFSQWDTDRESEDHWASNESRYLPEELTPYSDDFQRYGNWQYVTTVGYVWIPQVEVGWRPYWNGHWAWTPYGWTWVPYERWGWAPSHYGRWDYSASLGWYWLPGRTWGPAWVSWAVGGGYVGWCPLGRHDRPITAWGSWGGVGGSRFGRERGHAVARGQMVDAWSIVRQGQLGRRDVARLRVSPERIEPNVAVRVAETAQLRPTRDGSHLLQGEAVPRAIRTRPTPGDSVRELAVDNKTTIRSPWFRGGAASGGAVSRGSESTVGGAAQPSGSAQPGRSAERGGAVRRGESAPSQPQAGEAGGTVAAPHSRPVPWFRPSDDGGRSTGGTERGGGGAERRNDGGAARPAPRDAGERRAPATWPSGSTPPRRGEEVGSEPRHRDAGESRPDGGGAVYRPQSHDGGGSAPRSYGGEAGAARSRGENRPSGGGEVHSSGGAARPSGGEPRSSGGSSSGGSSSGGSSSGGGSSKSSGSGGSAEQRAPRPHNR